MHDCIADLAHQPLKSFAYMQKRLIVYSHDLHNKMKSAHSAIKKGLGPLGTGLPETLCSRFFFANHSHYTVI